MAVRRGACCFLLLATLVVSTAAFLKKNSPAHSPDKIVSVTFLIAVNSTETNCVHTTKSPPIAPDLPRNKSISFGIGDCDHAPLLYSISSSSSDEGDTFLSLTWYSSVIEDASPPTCKIKWNYDYNSPSREGSTDSLLPGCFVEDSREGAHMTYYWFYILDWSWG